MNVCPIRNAAAAKALLILASWNYRFFDFLTNLSQIKLTDEKVLEERNQKWNSKRLDNNILWEKYDLITNWLS